MSKTDLEMDSQIGAEDSTITSYAADYVEYVVSSQMEQETLGFIWSIKNVSGLPMGEMISSPLLPGGPKTNLLWQLQVLPKNRVVDEVTNAIQEYFSIFICFKPPANDSSSSINALMPIKVKASHQISLLDPDDKSGYQTGDPTRLIDYTEGQSRGYNKFITMEELFDPSRLLVVDDTVRIHCRIWIKCDLQHTMSKGRKRSETSTVTIQEDTYRRLKKLKMDFRSILEGSDSADVSLVTRTKTFQVHKCFLTARSPVFHAMFHSSMIESTQNFVEITDFDEDVVEGMLEYIYTGDTPSLVEKASELLQISDKYELYDLKEDCEEVLENNLKVETAAEVFVLARLHNAQRLKSQVIRYIKREKERFRHTEGFKRLVASNAAILMELFFHE